MKPRTFCLSILGGISMLAGASAQEGPVLKLENFSRDPQWEGRNHRTRAKEEPLMVTQDFGYSATRFAGQAEGEIGGRVQRSMNPALFADEFAFKTLDERLSASGSFAVTQADAGAGVFFGYFNGGQPGRSGQPIASLGLSFEFEEGGGRLAANLVNADNQKCGITIAPSLSTANKAVVIRTDGTRYRWTLEYDPESNDGNGRFKFKVKSDGKKAEPFEEETFVVELPAAFRKEGASFDRFGLMNLLETGGGATVFFDDLSYGEKREDFTIDPAWMGLKNRGTFAESHVAGAQNFGHQETNLAEGSGAGEVGGIFWRTDKDWGCYADRMATVTLKERLEAGGKVKLVTAGPGAEMYLGWFNSADTHADQPPANGRNFLGIRIGGSIRSGHCLGPLYRTSEGTEGKSEKGPVLKPGEASEWSLVYDPEANEGEGELRGTLDGETVVLPMKAEHIREGASFDRFGFFSACPNGPLVEIYFDDLRYSVGM